MWGATSLSLAWSGASGFQSTRPVWGATAPRIDGLIVYNVSIHAPRVGRDRWRYPEGGAPDWFQSTRPVWGATKLNEYIDTAKKFQSTRPVWGATIRQIRNVLQVVVSIHAPRVGRDARGYI